ncbi:glycosyltransferase [Cumulibacter manganitolerans]|uniref:glycosyltransferase n=1 Tax=Cumulibacter manganitolerans TaxID=1884992 RepID=UPI00188624D3|nr:glycosyltransferase [Cumulibacter manganitolerans]
MKILFVTESWPPAMNGVATSSVRLVEELRGRSHRIRVVAPLTSDSPGEELHAAKALRVGPTQEYTVGRLGARCVRMIEHWRPDLVHVASPLSVGYSALRAARRQAIPAIAAYMTDFTAFSAQAMHRLPGAQLTSRMAGRVQQALHSMATINIACSQYALGTLRGWRAPVPREWLRAIDTARFTPAARTQRLTTSATGTVTIGYAGRLAGEKELDLLIALRGIPGARLKVIGDGPARGRLERLLPEAEFTGRLRGPTYPEAVASLDLFVHPGRGETLSQVVLEALSSGVPCIVPDAGSGSTELVAPGLSGRHFAGGDGGSLRAAALAELASPGRAPGEIAATVAHRTWDSSMSSLLASYDEALGAR